MKSLLNFIRRIFPPTHSPHIGRAINDLSLIRLMAHEDIAMHQQLRHVPIKLAQRWYH